MTNRVLFSTEFDTSSHVADFYLSCRYWRWGKDEAFMGWFGPRGLASIVFALIVLNENMEGGKMLGTVVVCTVCLSIVAHGVTAIPRSKAIVEKIVRHKK